MKLPNLFQLGREVVLQRVALVGALDAVFHVAVASGWITPALNTAAERQITGIFDVVAVVVTAFAVRAGVTPVKAPRDNIGQPLLPASEHPAAVSSATVDGPVLGDPVTVPDVPALLIQAYPPSATSIAAPTSLTTDQVLPPVATGTLPGSSAITNSP